MRLEFSAEVLPTGLHAYAEKRVAGGDTLHFRISNDTGLPHRLDVVKLGADPDSTAGDVTMPWPVQTLAVPHVQAINPGSYVYIAQGLPVGTALTSFTVECWVRPLRLGWWQGLITQHDFPDRCAFGLFLSNLGTPYFYVGNGGAFVAGSLLAGAGPLELDRWYHVVGRWNGIEEILSVSDLANERVTRQACRGPMSGAAVPIRLGAYAASGVTGQFLDADLAMPALYSRALTDTEIHDRRDAVARSAPAAGSALGDALLGCWPLGEERGSHVADASPFHRDGSIVNHGTWMVGGPGFDIDSDAVPPGDARDDLGRGHALRLMPDDLFDCGWQVTETCAVPSDAKPGMYVGRITYGPFLAKRYDVTFVVTKASNRPKAPIVVLCNTNTWLAYNSPAFIADPTVTTGWGTGNPGYSVAGTPTFSAYVPHANNTPAFHIGVEVPWPAAQPYVRYEGPNSDYSHLVRAERYLHNWLDARGYDYDVITDFDLHEQGKVLSPYSVLILNGHSEYWSAPAYQALNDFLNSGGNLVLLSGNTMFWRVSLDDTSRVMECRKYVENDNTGTGATLLNSGLRFHSDDGRPGGLMRQCGYPAWKVIGAEAAGFGPPFGSFELTDGSHPVTSNPTPTGLAIGDTFGFAQTQTGAFCGAVGHEGDVTVGSLLPPATSVTDPEIPIASPAGVRVIARSVVAGCTVWDYECSFRVARAQADVIGEMFWWDRPGGGIVFHMGSIAAGWSLATDPAMQTILSNALTRFGV
jgi:hypothetical protein